MKTIMLGVEVASARDLMPKDGQGSASAYVELNFDGKRFHTTIKVKDLNPVWNERFYFNVSDPSKIHELALDAYVYTVNRSAVASRSFLGKVKIHGTSFMPVKDSAVLYFPLEKRGMFSRVKGELGLSVYLTCDPSIGAPNSVSEMDHVSDNTPPTPSTGEKQIAVDMTTTDLNTSQEHSFIRTSNNYPQMNVAICSPNVHISNHLDNILWNQSSIPHAVTLHQLKEITDNFSQERILGHGGFGVVYKGVLQNGNMIAVKKIVHSFMPGMQKKFENEVYHLMMLKHPNIVRLIGYCYETQNAWVEDNGKHIIAETTERLLCLEYLPNGSLDNYLSDESCGLNWSTRYKIIEGVCYGLSHLHEQVDNPIIHLDLKPANILLDDGMVPKIADFGLSRLLDQQNTICTTTLNGTLGYMAPEFLHGGTVTPMSDIFSLGVIILEVITGHRDYPDVTRESSDDYINLRLQKWRAVLQRPPCSRSLEIYCAQIKRCIQIGLICVNPDRKKRPRITEVISMLHGPEIFCCDISNEDA